MMMTDKNKKDNPASPEHEDLNVLMVRRREELAHLKEMGINPYPAAFERKDLSREIIASFKDEAPQRTVAIAGRIMTLRRMGKASFCHIQDSEGKIQVYLKKDDLGSVYDAFKLKDIGDIIGVQGFVFRTKMGEVSVHAQKLELLAKSLRPLPVVKEKEDEHGNKIIYDPFSDKELRYRQRYVDLAVNPDVRDAFVKRARLISAIRSFFDKRNYLEVETPILQPVYGGASARPFVTHHNALDIDLYLRIADELYLKRLIVGGFDGVYEIAKDFRNEGMDKNHNPEFTILELYVAYWDYQEVMNLLEEMMKWVAHNALGSNQITYNEHRIDLTPPWGRVSLLDSIQEKIGVNLLHKKTDEIWEIATNLDLRANLIKNRGKLIEAIFEEKVQPFLVAPTFITDYPVEMSPLAKRHRSNPFLTERFELFIGAAE